MKPSLCTKIVSIFTALAVVLASFSFKLEKNSCQLYTADASADSAIESCCGFARTIDENSQLSQISCCSSLAITVEGFNDYEKALSSPFSTQSYFVFESTPLCAVKNCNARHYGMICAGIFWVDPKQLIWIKAWQWVVLSPFLGVFVFIACYLPPAMRCAVRLAVCPPLILRPLPNFSTCCVACFN